MLNRCAGVWGGLCRSEPYLPYPCYTYDMAHRTTLILDDETRKAARELAVRYDCSASEAIRRAVIRHRDAVFGVPESRRHERRKILDQLFDLFDGHDAEGEIRRLKEEDMGFPVWMSSP